MFSIGWQLIDDIAIQGATDLEFFIEVTTRIWHFRPICVDYKCYVRSGQNNVTDLNMENMRELQWI
jgi:hypothetical protein